VVLNSNPVKKDNYLSRDPNDRVRYPFFEEYKGGILGSDGKKVYFIGIIDIFTQYG
jgi:hypothetical protein